ncbi:uncharacterized protein LOC119741333 [Patiria miniata]|uniref:Reverse transcriptase domain-containing protein n=1 Tax=Patiria miniata TaxID=46514 RepID=A0A914BC50_PATMI|nr:uncharacterized protein LOC119741333 [Patiria miniata]
MYNFSLDYYLIVVEEFVHLSDPESYAGRSSFTPSRATQARQQPAAISPRLMSLRMCLSTGYVTLISAYAPTLTSTPESKDDFYLQLSELLHNIPAGDGIILLGDFNARIGSDCSAWKNVIGPHGVGRMNDNGQRLLELCASYNLCIANTFFAGSVRSKVTWKHPRSQHWHQLDHIIVRQRQLRDTTHCRSLHSADCNTDHALVRCKLRLLLKKFHRATHRPLPAIDTVSTHDISHVTQFQELLSGNFSSAPISANPEGAWSRFRSVVYNSAVSAFGRCSRKQPDWFRDSADILLPAPENKRSARNKCRLINTRSSKAALRAAKSTVQRLTRAALQRYWSHLSDRIQRCADSGDLRGLYQGIKEAIGPTPKKSAPLLSSTGAILTDQTAQLDRWVEHYSSLYNSDAALPILKEVDNSITLEEVKHAINGLKNNKAPGTDSIPPEVIANRILPESQCGFRPSRSTVDMVFSLRQLQEKCVEQRRPLYMVFIDLTKAFDNVSRSGLFSILKRLGCPDRYLSILMCFHDDMHATVQFNGSRSAKFEVRRGVKQGCVLAPTLFGIFFSALLHRAFPEPSGILLHTRSSGNFFDLSRLRARTKIRHVLIRELLYADDAAIVAHSADELQHLCNSFASACSEFGMIISLGKTMVLSQGPGPPPMITINGTPLSVVNKFQYLGSTVTSTNSLDTELDSRIGRAATTFGRLRARVWDNRALSIKLKIRIYVSCVLSVLLYCSESWPTYRRQERRLNAFHFRCLRSILGISWQDRVSNPAILELTGVNDMFTLLSARRLRWSGHVCRQEDGRLPKDIFFGELAHAHRPRGRPKIRYKDVLKRDLRTFRIPVTSWQTVVQDRTRWRSAVHLGRSASSAAYIADCENRRAARHRATSSYSTG